MDILTKIDNHRHAYHNAGYDEIDIPYFRITCKEHKELLNSINKRFKLADDKKYQRIAEYTGIKLIIVQEIEDYCL